MEHARYHHSIAKYTYAIDYLETLPSKKSYLGAQECADAALKYGKSRFKNRLVNIKILKDGKVVDTWQQ